MSNPITTGKDYWPGSMVPHSTRDGRGLPEPEPPTSVLVCPHSDSRLQLLLSLSQFEGFYARFVPAVMAHPEPRAPAGGIRLPVAHEYVGPRRAGRVKCGGSRRA